MSGRSSASIAPRRVWTARRCGVLGPATKSSSGPPASTPPAPMRPPCCNSSASTGRSKTACTTCGTASSTKTAPRSVGARLPRSWRRCATWPSASCARPGRRASPAPCVGARATSRWSCGSSACARKRGTPRADDFATGGGPRRWTTLHGRPQLPPTRRRESPQTSHPRPQNKPSPLGVLCRLCGLGAKSGPLAAGPYDATATTATSATPCQGDLVRGGSWW